MAGLLRQQRRSALLWAGRRRGGCWRWSERAARYRTWRGDRSVRCRGVRPARSHPGPRRGACRRV